MIVFLEENLFYILVGIITVMVFMLIARGISNAIKEYRIADAVFIFAASIASVILLMMAFSFRYHAIIKI